MTGEVKGLSKSAKSYTSRRPTADGGATGSITGTHFWAGGLSEDESEGEDMDEGVSWGDQAGGVSEILNVITINY